MCGSASESQESAAEGIFVEPPLSFVLLQGLLEVGGGELKNAGLGPVGEQVEEIAQVAPGLDAMEFAAGDQRDEGGVGGGAVFGSYKEPVFATHRFFSQVSLGDVVRHRQATVVEETLERLLLVDGVANGGIHRRVVEDEVLLGPAPSEEVANNGARLLVAHRLLLFSGLIRDGPLGFEQRRQIRECDLGSVGV